MLFLKLELRRFCFKRLSLSSPFIYLTFFFPFFHSNFLLPGPSPDVCLLAVLLFKNILSMPLRASVR
uniref:Uncharacterized protein n=1 Tax=Cyanistes caeruleus TaxID=156563 RepID=A0A8C0VKH7_CYACU